MSENKLRWGNQREDSFNTRISKYIGGQSKCWTWWSVFFYVILISKQLSLEQQRHCNMLCCAVRCGVHVCVFWMKCRRCDGQQTIGIRIGIGKPQVISNRYSNTRTNTYTWNISKRLEAYQHESGDSVWTWPNKTKINKLSHKHTCTHTHKH